MTKLYELSEVYNQAFTEFLDNEELDDRYLDLLVYERKVYVAKRKVTKCEVTLEKAKGILKNLTALPAPSTKENNHD